MEDESVVSQLNVVAVLVCVLDRRKIRDYQLQERLVGDVPGRHDEQAAGRAAEQVPIAKVGVLGDNDPISCIGDVADLAVGRPIAVGHIRRVRRVMPPLTQQRREPRGQLRVDEEPHAALSGLTL